MRPLFASRLNPTKNYWDHWLFLLCRLRIGLWTQRAIPTKHWLVEHLLRYNWCWKPDFFNSTEQTSPDYCNVFCSSALVLPPHGYSRRWAQTWGESNKPLSFQWCPSIFLNRLHFKTVGIKTRRFFGILDVPFRHGTTAQTLFISKRGPVSKTICPFLTFVLPKKYDRAGP